MAKSDQTKRVAPTKGCAFIVREDFDYADKQFEAGESFPYAELGLAETQAMNLWKASIIEVDPDVEDDGDGEPLVPDPVDPVAELAAAEAARDAEADDSAPAAAKKAAKKPRASSKR